ncbi:nuclear transport factor 2 family protein [Micromonospora sp. DR5-3]|uniref:nuclear transport factor 2 family protein n=1 Tax=unclassified Micromonospora TaxID=2617518 RepID=UPI002104EE14|nr:MULTISPECIES: nuclear transport factor 2 family protein [unclassified Micromonospora]MCW3816209.1 nuclear transport factor 2 family protein [Micromonospora sp. DR5-3]
MTALSHGSGRWHLHVRQEAARTMHAAQLHEREAGMDAHTTHRKIALITGANKGIGRATAEQFGTRHRAGPGARDHYLCGVAVRRRGGRAPPPWREGNDVPDLVYLALAAFLVWAVSAPSPSPVDPARRLTAAAGTARPTAGPCDRDLFDVTKEKPMSDFQTIADRVEIEALRGEFTDAVMMRDYDRLASLFTPDGALRMPNIPAELIGQAEIRAWGERVPDFVDFLVQNTHPGTIALDGDTATGRAYMSELGRTRDGRQGLNYAIYHDRYQRTSDGWKFAERVYEVRYEDSTPLAGSPPSQAAR